MCQNNKCIEYKVGIRATIANTDDIGATLRRTVSAWVHRDIREEAERAEHTTMMLHLLGAAALMSLVLPIILVSFFTLQVAIPISLVSAALSLFLAGILAQTGKLKFTAAATLVVSAFAIASLALATGGLASPFLFWSMIIPIEAVLIGKSRRSLAFGVLAMGAVLVGVALAQSWWILPITLDEPGQISGSAVSIGGLLAYGLLVGAPFFQRRSTAIPVPERASPQGQSVLDRLPGVVTIHDENSRVRATHGSDVRQQLKLVGDINAGGFLDHVHVSDRIEFLRSVDQLRTGYETQSLIVRMRSLGASEQDQFRHWSIHLAAIRDGEGTFDGFIAQSRDVTAEMELRRSYVRKVGEAEAANEAKTRFLAAVSHELRTPLNAILGFSDILTSELVGPALDENQAEYVTLIRQSGQHLLEVINSMLDLSKIDAGRYELNLEPFDVREAIRSCEAMLRQQANENQVVLTTRVAKGHVELTACRRAVQQILINLIANAIKFTDENGVVSVDVADGQGFTSISVSDTGIGICEADLEKIGSPFVQLQSDNARQYEGTGLGLSLVKGLVELHSGRFRIESTPGVGTTVTIDLPIAGPEQSGDDAEPQIPANAVFPPRLAPMEETEESHAQAKTA